LGIIVKGHNQNVSRALVTNPVRHKRPLGFIKLIIGIKKIKPIAIVIIGSKLDKLSSMPVSNPSINSSTLAVP